MNCSRKRIMASSIGPDMDTIVTQHSVVLQVVCHFGSICTVLVVMLGVEVLIMGLVGTDCIVGLGA